MRIRSFRLAFLVCVSGAVLIAQTPQTLRAFLEGGAIDSTTNAPLTQVRVKLVRGLDEPIYAKADSQGRFAFNNLERGTYRLYIDAPGYHQLQTFVDLTAARADGVVPAVTRDLSNVVPMPRVSNTVGEDGTIHSTVSAPMLAYGVISGRVVDPYGVPMAGSWVEIHEQSTAQGQNGRTLATTADNSGAYRLAGLDPGAYIVSANKSYRGVQWGWQSNYRVTYFPAALDPASAQPVTLAPGQQARADIQILRQTGVSVSGRVMGPPVSSGPFGLYTRLALVPEQSAVLNPDTPFVTARADFEFEDVLPGRYTLFAVTEDPSSDPMGANRKPLFGLVKDVEIGAQDMAGFDLNLAPIKNIAGTVEISGACSQLPLLVQLHGRNPLSPAPVEAAVGPDHQFVLTNVPAGRFALSVGAGQQSTVHLTGATRGTHDLMKEGIESPSQDDEPVKLTVACRSQGGRQ